MVVFSIQQTVCSAALSLCVSVMSLMYIVKTADTLVMGWYQYFGFDFWCVIFKTHYNIVALPVLLMSFKDLSQ